jgi:hypothetical protein
MTGFKQNRLQGPRNPDGKVQGIQMARNTGGKSSEIQMAKFKKSRW